MFSENFMREFFGMSKRETVTTKPPVKYQARKFVVVNADGVPTTIEGTDWTASGWLSINHDGLTIAHWPEGQWTYVGDEQSKPTAQEG